MSKLKKAMALCLAGGMVLSGISGDFYAQAAKKKKVGLSHKKLTLTVKQKKTVKLKNYAGKKKVKWVISKKIAKITPSGKKKTQLQIVAKKPGTAKLTARAGKKKYTCTLKINKKKTSITTPTSTAKPTALPQATASPKPTALPQATASPKPDYNTIESMKRWQNDRFGMFIHFGSYSYYGQGEWAMQTQKISKENYQTNISSKFDPQNFNAEEIVAEAKNAGMKYLIFTAKHHEGLSMWDTKVDSFKDYTGTKMYSLQKFTPFGSTERDIIRELKDACDAAGIKFGLYYSIIDWNHPSQEIARFNGGFTDMSSMEARTDYIKDMKAQLKELITLYDPEIMWFDGDWLKYNGEPRLDYWWTKNDGQELYDYMKSLKPGIIVNERVCRGFGLGDFECPEQSIPSSALSRPWETCQTMNGAWGYDQSKENSYRSAEEIICELPDVVSKDGNYLLNIGPKGDGSVTEGSKTILSAFGEWMKKNSESIYGASSSPFTNKPSWGVYTKKDNTVYAHVFTNTSNSVSAECYKDKQPKKVYLLATGEELTYRMENNQVLIDLPQEAVDPADTVIAMEY